MSSDNERQGKSKPKKRRHIVISETDSSDEYDTPTTKNRRKQRINKLRSDMRKLGKETKIDLEASCSSHSVQGDKNLSEKKINGKVSSDVSDSETIPKSDPRSSQTTKSPEKSEVNKDAPPPVSSDANENDKKNENSQGVDKCPICWAPFEHQEIAIPSSCDHRFCYDCIMKWSKNTNTCPVDRLEFRTIEVRPNISGKPMLYIQIEPRTQHDTDEEDFSHFMVFTTDEELSSSREESDANPVFSLSEDEEEEEEERHSCSTNDFDEDEYEAEQVEEEGEEEVEEEEDEEGDEPVEEDPDSFSSHENQESSPITVDDDGDADDFWGSWGSDNNSSASAQTSDEQSSSHSAESYRLEPSIMDSSNSPSYWDNNSPASSFISSPSSLSPF